MKSVTIKDVAALAEVSITTVSLVLNGRSESIPESTKGKVYEAAKQLNYIPSANARAMVTKRTYTVGVIIPDISNAFFSELVCCMQLEFAELGYDIILCNGMEKFENDLKYIRALSARDVDGLIIAPSAESLIENNRNTLLNTLNSLNLPYLFVDRYLDDASKVAVDNEKSSFIAVEYLLQNGHTHIGFITGPLTLNSSLNRLRGAKRAMQKYGCRVDDDLIIEGNYDFQTGKAGAEVLIEKGVTAIFAFSDAQAFGVYETARVMGLKIGKDISVIGFDDVTYSKFLDVPLTTMRQPIKQLASRACGYMLNLINGNHAFSIDLCAELIERNSVCKL